MGLLVLLIFTVVLGVIMFGGIVLMNRALAWTVGARHHALQEIAETGLPPVAWRRPFERKLERLSGSPNAAARSAEVRRQATATYLKKLDDLTRYFEKSLLIDGEDTRKIVMEKLQALRDVLLREDNPASPTSGTS